MRLTQTGYFRWMLCAALFALVELQAAEIVRGPYIQNVTPESAVIKWRTDVPASSVVHYGLTEGVLNQTATLAGTRIEHEVPITGLDPETVYFYDVGEAAGVLAGGTPDFYFKTNPPQGADRKLRFWAIGDFGTNDNNQRSVRDGFYQYNNGKHVDAWLMLGDHAYGNGTEEQHQNAVFNMYPTLLRNTCVWPTRGNHERVASAHYGAWIMPTAAEAGGVASGTEAYYSYDIGTVHFVCLDSYATDRSVGGAMLNWLESDLASTSQEFIICYWHHPPYTKGSHDSDREGDLIQIRQNILPILDLYGVDLVLSGHSHSYERSYQIRGHYGHSSTFNNSMLVNGGSGDPDTDGAYVRDSVTEGVVYAVAGASGRISGSIPAQANWHPVMVEMQRELGSMLIEVTGGRMDVKYINGNAQVTDEFSIIHPEVDTPFVLFGEPSLITYDRATVNADVLSTGSAPTTVSIAWGSTDEGEDLAAWPFSESLGLQTEGPISYELLGLDGTTTYTYRLVASNANGVSWTPPGTFTTARAEPEITGYYPLLNDTGPDGELIPIDAVWRYDDSGNSQPFGWTAVNHNDDGWSSGPAELGYGNGDEATVVDFGNAFNKHRATFFRHTFNVDDPFLFENLVMTLKADDGAIVHFNGQEVYRKNMPNGNANNNTFASSTDPNDGNPPLIIPLSENLQAGSNTVAVQVHIPNVFEPDMSFALSLSADVLAPVLGATNATYEGADIDADLINEGQSPTTVTLYYGPVSGGTNVAAWANNLSLGVQAQGRIPFSITGLTPETEYYYRYQATNPAGVDWSELGTFTTTSQSPTIDLVSQTTVTEDAIFPAGSSWRYLDTGTDLGTVWRAPSFDDSSWASGVGELGYGDGDEDTVISFGPDGNNKHRTTYFRRTFPIIGNQYDQIRLSLKRDDGAVVYLNGSELLRSNMPGGTINYNTFAAGSASGDGNTPESIIRDVPLSPGFNTLAVEIHQHEPESSDKSFDLALFATRTVDGVVSNLTPTSVDLTGTLRVEGQGPTTVRVLVGKTDGGDNPLAWEMVQVVGVTSQGEFPFSITGLEPETTYVYRLEAINAFGTDVSDVAGSFTTLRIRPSILQKSEARSISYTSAGVDAFLVDAGTTETSVEVFLGLSDGGTDPAAWTTSENIGVWAEGDIPWSLTGLQANTTYFYRFRATNAGGSDWSQETGSFTTLNGAPVINTQSVSGILPGQATPSIRLVEDFGVPVTLTLFYGPSNAGQNPAAWESSITLGTRPEGISSRTIAGLSDTTTYYVTWRATSAYGTTWLAAPSVFFTPSGDPAVANNPAASVSFTSASANGSLINDHNAATTVTLYYGQTDGGQVAANWDVSIPLGNRPEGALFRVLTGLSPETTYYYSYFAQNGFGETWAIPSTSFTTLNPLPTIENTPDQTTTGPTTASVAGNLVRQGDGVVAVTLYWGTTDGGTSPASWQNATLLGNRPVGSLVTDLSGLSPGTTYYYRYFASNRGGTDWASLTSTFATGNVAAPVVTTPVALPAANSSPTSATMVGQLQSNGGQTTSITLYYGTTDGGVLPANWDQVFVLGNRGVGPLAAQVSGLQPGTTYYYRYFAEHAFGESWSSPSASFTTPSADAVLEHAAPIVGNGGTRERVVLPRECYWRYLDDGSDQGLGWTAPAFDDRSWKLGQAKLGYGTDQNTTVAFGLFFNKHVTTYFRSSFYVENATDVIQSIYRIKADDGALVYLNGSLIRRSNMPPGAVNSQTLAASEGTVFDDDFLQTALAPGFLVSGTNTIAVEIHQSSTTGADIGFDLEWSVQEQVSGDQFPGASSLTPNSATLDYSITDDGGDPPAVWIVYGLAEDGAFDREDWDFASSLGVKGEGDHSTTLTGLTPGQRVYYRLQTVNSSGTIWSEPYYIDVPSGDADDDGDGMTDLWEVQYFGASDVPVADATADPDLDGLSNVHEFLANSDPNDASSGFFLDVSAIDDTECLLSCATQANARYLLEKSPKLPGGSWTPETLVIGSGARATFRAPIPQTHQYYRLRMLDK